MELEGSDNGNNNLEFGALQDQASIDWQQHNDAEQILLTNFSKDQLDGLGGIEDWQLDKYNPAENQIDNSIHFNGE